MNENEFWFRIWALIAGCVCTFVVCITVGINYTNYLQLTALSSASDPIAMSCAIYPYSSGACMVANKK